MREFLWPRRCCFWRRCCSLLLLLAFPEAAKSFISHAFLSPLSSLPLSKSKAIEIKSETTSLPTLQWLKSSPKLLWDNLLTKNINKKSTQSIGERNGRDLEYPWRFEGRFIFRPSLVHVPEVGSPVPSSATLLSVVG